MRSCELTTRNSPYGLYWLSFLQIGACLLALFPPAGTRNAVEAIVSSSCGAVAHHWRLAKRSLVFNGRLANRQVTSLAKEATDYAFE